MDFGGTTVGSQLDPLVISGAVALGGTLHVANCSGFLPVSGSGFTQMTNAPQSGAFVDGQPAADRVRHAGPDVLFPWPSCCG